VLSAAAAAAAAAWFAGLLASWAEFMQLLLHQQQQQRSSGLADVTYSLLVVEKVLATIWFHMVQDAPTAVTTVVGAALPLLRQLHSCGRLLCVGETAAAAAAAAGDVSRSSKVQAKCCEVQYAFGDLVCQLGVVLVQQKLNTQSAAQAVSLLCEPAVAELLLQQLTVHTMLLHQDHSKQQQQQSLQSSKQQHRADLLPIPAFHQHPDMLQLLPGGQAYLDTVGQIAAAVRNRYIARDGWPKCSSRDIMLVVALELSLRHICMPQQGSSRIDVSVPTLSAAVQLVLEVHLLAASAVQCLQQQPSEIEVVQNHPFQLLLASMSLLHNQIAAILQAGSSCLPPEVLQQAGLQLLQALATPLQQLQQSAADSRWRAVAVQAAASESSSETVSHGTLDQQLLALKAAAPGMAC
jgi:hypothetical protein